MVKPLPPMQLRFVAEYMIDLNGTAAAKRAGYSPKTAETQAARMLGNVRVQTEIARRQQAREFRTEITQDRVLKELARIAFFDIRKLYREDGAMKLPSELDDDTAAALVGIDIAESRVGEDGPLTITTRKAKVIERTGALSLVMRHLGMLTDKLEVKDVTAVADRLRHARERRRG